MDINGNNEPLAAETPKDDPLESERQRKRDYYHTNRAKIEASKKRSCADKNKKICESKKLPLSIAPYVHFYSPTRHKPDRIGLKFESTYELLTFLVSMKYENEGTWEELERTRLFYEEKIKQQTRKLEELDH